MRGPGRTARKAMRAYAIVALSAPGSPCAKRLDDLGPELESARMLSSSSGRSGARPWARDRAGNAGKAAPGWRASTYLDLKAKFFQNDCTGPARAFWESSTNKPLDARGKLNEPIKVDAKRYDRSPCQSTRANSTDRAELAARKVSTRYSRDVQPDHSVGRREPAMMIGLTWSQRAS